MAIPESVGIEALTRLRRPMEIDRNTLRAAWYQP
jgi:hypothetical protein